MLRVREWGQRHLRVKHCHNGGVMGSEARRRMHFLVLVPFFLLFSLCFPIPFLRDHGKVKVVLQNGAVKIERKVPAQPQFFQVKCSFS